MPPAPETTVAVIGGGVVGAATAHALASRGVDAVLLEAMPELGLAASGTNSGILHAGFDSEPGTLETELILRAAELREEVLPRLGVPVLRCGAELRPLEPGDEQRIAALAENAERNGVDVTLRDDGVLEVPGEAVTDPVALVLALAAAAEAGGVEVRTSAGVESVERVADGLSLGLADGSGLRCRAAVNAAGLFSDEVARLAGDDSFEVYPRKGEFFVFDRPAGRPLERILLPVPSERTKGVLVFPTVDGKVIAGPTAHDQEDKRDWSVRPEAADAVLPKAERMLPGLAGAEPIASYTGLRPAGRGVNYVIGPSAVEPLLINAAAIRSTGMTSSLAIAERIAGHLAEAGVELGPVRELEPASPPPEHGPWWRRTAEHWAHA